jgi:hypothetical protein
VAPCYPGGHPALTLKDGKGGIAGVFVDESFDMRALPVGAPGKALTVGRQQAEASQAVWPMISVTLPPESVLKAGTYDIFLPLGDKTGRPKIALPLAGDDGHKRDRLGTIVVG